MTLGRFKHLGHLLPMRTVFHLLFGVMYLLKPRLRFCLSICLGMCCPEVSWWLVSDLTLDLIHSVILIIDLIPRLRHLYFLQTFLAPSETNITVMVAPIIMIIMSRVYYVRNTGNRWALAMMRLSVKTPNLNQCLPLPVDPHSFSSLLISDKIYAKALFSGLVLEH